MSLSNIYKKQVELLLDVLPIIQQDNRFALKGGTAINLFHRNMPRLSVDIDLTYLPLEPRDVFLDNLTQAMASFTYAAEAKGLVVNQRLQTQHIVKLIISNNSTTIKVEPNTILRGSVFPTCETELVNVAQDEFLQTQTVKMLSIADLYGGKICAALDRQHPRDLFDIKLLLENEGITTPIRQAFIVYLASGSRPMSELLAPNLLDLSDTFNKEFIGMTNIAITYKTLLGIRQQLIDIIKHDLQPNEKAFLISIKSAKPQWDLLPLAGLDKLPAIQWKLINIRKMSSTRRQAALDKLKKVLEY